MITNKYFILTVDTESDNEWSRPLRDEITTQNASVIPKFHELCRRFNIRPVYLVDYQMSQNKILQMSLKKYLKEGECEIGAHLHPWSTPPFHFSVTDNDYKYHPFCTEYPLDIFTEKMNSLVVSIQNNFGVSPKSFRAGRYVISKNYLLPLKEMGFQIDCSVTPYYHWEPYRNAAGSDFTSFTPVPFFWDDENIFLEVPLSAMELGQKRQSVFNPYCYRFFSKSRMSKVLDKILGSYQYSLKPAKCFFRYKKFENINYFIKKYIERTPDLPLQAMLHSSELMLGGCFKNEKKLSQYWKSLEESFKLIKSLGYESKTLLEFYNLTRPGHFRDSYLVPKK